MNTDKGPLMVGRPRHQRGNRGFFLVPTVRLSIGTVVLLFIGRGLYKLLVRMVRHPIATGIGAALAAGWIWFGPQALLATLGVTLGLVAAAALVWRYADPVSFGHWVRIPVRSRWRKRWVYGRNWQPAMLMTGLTEDPNYLPAIRRVRSTDRRDLVQVRMVPGQRPSDYADAAEQLAYTFGAVRMTVRRDPKSHERVWLDFHKTADVTTMPPMDHLLGRSKSSVA